MSNIHLKINKKLNLQIPEFNCDNNPIGTHLNKYDMLKHFNHTVLTVVVEQVY